MLNTIVADAFDRMAEKLASFPKKEFHARLQAHLREIIKTHKRIIFNGDGYAEGWLKEAAKRGLPNFRTTMDALKALTDKKNMELLKKYGVFQVREIESRYEVFMEDYHRKVKIEGKVVYLKLVGHCGSCPFAMMTLKQGIEAGLQEIDPEITVERVVEEPMP